MISLELCSVSRDLRVEEVRRKWKWKEEGGGRGIEREEEGDREGGVGRKGEE